MKLLEISIVCLFIFTSQNCSDDKLKENRDKQPAEKTDFSNLVFVGDSATHTLFLYNLKDKSVKELWTNKTDKIIDLLYSDDRKTVYFITVRKWGSTGNIPYINDVKLYLINPESLKIKFIESIGTGIQVFAQWENEISFSVRLNTFDKTVSSRVNQNTKIFNTFGKKLTDETRSFDIIKDGYPVIQKRIRYANDNLLLEKQESDSILRLINSGENKIIVIGKIQGNINRIEWINEMNAVIFSSSGFIADNPDSASITGLYIYSLNEDKIISRWTDGRLNNFDIIGNYFFFDKNINNKSVIIVHDLSAGRTIDTIQIKGGCGLRNIL